VRYLVFVYYVYLFIKKMNKQEEALRTTAVPLIEEAPEVDWEAEEEDAKKEQRKKKKISSSSHLDDDDDDEEEMSSEEEKKKKKKKKKEQQQLDPLVAIMMKEEAVKLCSTLAAKLELIRFDEDRNTVFRVSWISDLFHVCLKRLNMKTMENFNIESWYNEVLQNDESSSAKPTTSRRKTTTDYRISPALTKQTVQTNWLLPLFQLEIETPGFLVLFHNHLDLEEQIYKKMATGAKEETEYNWIQTGSLSKPTPLAIEAPKGGTVKYITQGGSSSSSR
jgi:hypothetical protein